VGGDGAAPAHRDEKEEPMAKYVHVSLDLPASRGKTLIYAKTVLEVLTGNANFVNPSPSLLVFEAKIAVLDELEVKARNREPGAASARDAAREQVREHLFHTRDYVQGVVETLSGTVDLGAVRAVVESVAMRLRKVSRPAKFVFAAKPGEEAGSVDLTAPASKKRDTHEWQHSGDQETWESVVGTRQARTTITGLPVGQVRYFRHRLLTKDGPTAWCAPVMLMVK
jgi:hypothetical protein